MKTKYVSAACSLQFRNWRVKMNCFCSEQEHEEYSILWKKGCDFLSFLKRRKGALAIDISTGKFLGKLCFFEWKHRALVHGIYFVCSVWVNVCVINLCFIFCIPFFWNFCKQYLLISVKISLFMFLNCIFAYFLSIQPEAPAVCWQHWVR